SDYGPWKGSFRVEPLDGKRRVIHLPPVTPLPQAGSGEMPGLTKFRGLDRNVFYFVVTGSAEGSVWGTDVYTDDSSLAVAAVHAGILRPGQKGLVKVAILPGREKYEGSTRNGVTTQGYSAWHGSYRIEAVRAPDK